MSDHAENITGKKTDRDLISIIVPCYNEEKALPAFYRAAADAVKDIRGADCEFIFVDDGSRDNTPEILEHFSAIDPRCRYLSFSRNFGKEAAMYAGLQNASGDYCVFMDADLQHPPELLKEMYRVLKTEDYDCCAGLREDRSGENPLRTFLSRSFYHNRYMKGIFSFVGFETKWIPFHNAARTAGETKWSLRSLFRYAMDGILSFSTAPSTIAGAAGILLLFAALAAGVSFLISGRGLSGIPLVICLILALNGVQMLFLSILGQYMSKEYMESKRRPIYIVKKKGGF